MFVCHCRVVSDSTVRQVIDRGARSVDEVATVCGAGSACGGCVPTIQQLLADADVAVQAPALLRAQQSTRRRLVARVPALQPAPAA